MAEQRKSKEAIAVAFWCPRELGAKADSVAEAEMMSRSAWRCRQGGRGTCVSELQPLYDETVSANGSARCHFRFRLEQLAVARADNGGRCKCAVYKHLFKTDA